METALAPPASTIRPLLGVGCAGLLSGVLGALARDDETLRPLAHLIGPWILLAVVVSAGQRPERAAVRSALGLVAAVVAFYVGTGQPSSLRVGQMALWCVLALLGGPVLGLLFHRIGHHGPPAVVGTASALGLLIGDVLNELDRFGSVVTLYLFALLSIGTVLALSRPTWRRFLVVLVLTLPASAIGMALVATPDDLEKLLLTGF
jgi:Family of unknown function (DUF6518)